MFNSKFIFIKRVFVCFSLSLSLSRWLSSISLSVALVRFSSERMFEPVARASISPKRKIAASSATLRKFGCSVLDTSMMNTARMIYEERVSASSAGDMCFGFGAVRDQQQQQQLRAIVEPLEVEPFAFPSLCVCVSVCGCM